MRSGRKLWILLGVVLASAVVASCSNKREPKQLSTPEQAAQLPGDTSIDQGTGTVEALAAEMKKTRTLHLWWDSVTSSARGAMRCDDPN